MTRLSRLIALIVLAVPCVAAAQEAASERDAWRTEITAQRARADAQRQQLKADLEKRKIEAQLNPVPRDVELARRATDQVLNDYSLQRGDIVSTANGLFVYLGSADSNERSPNDFVPVGRPAPAR